ncbi:pol, partial [Mucuna pruriens]
MSPWYVDICNYLVTSTYPIGASKDVKERLESNVKYYIWDDPYLWRACNDQVTRKCVPKSEINSVLHFCHSTIEGGHYGLMWMAQKPILFCEIFDVWGINFTGSFPVSCRNYYVLLAVDYVSRWVEARVTKTNDAKIVVDFVKSNIFCRFGMLKALINDQGSHFYNCIMAMLLKMYGVVHRVATIYHPQTNGNLKSSIRKLRKDGKFELKRLKSPLRGCFECHPTELSSVKLVTYWSRLSIKLTRQSRSAIWDDQANRE